MAALIELRKGAWRCDCGREFAALTHIKIERARAREHAAACDTTKGAAA